MKPPKRWLVFSALALQIGGVMYFAALVGRYLDQKQNHDKPLFTLLFCLFGLIAIVYMILKQTKNL